MRVQQEKNPVHKTNSHFGASRNVLAHHSLWRFQNVFIFVQFCAAVEQENHSSEGTMLQCSDHSSLSLHKPF